MQMPGNFEVQDGKYKTVNRKSHISYQKTRSIKKKKKQIAA